MATFTRRLASCRAAGTADESRRWIFVPYDQLNDTIGPLSEQAAGETGIVLVESSQKASRRPYHKRKLALVLANMRHFALEQARRGVRVDYRFSERGYADVLDEVTRERGPLEVMEPAERELRLELAPLVERRVLRVVPHAGWLTTSEDFAAAQDGPPWRMDSFYRHVRRRTGILMRDGAPEGGRFSFDGDNRRRWSGDPPAPPMPVFEPDEVTREVVDLVDARFGGHPGRLDPAALPATLEDAERLWRWAQERCLPHFGPYQDAMSHRSESLFHTRISSLLHLHRLLPERVVGDVQSMELPIASREGFVRQVLGWREFVRHVHRATDGLRDLPRNALGADAPLPPVFWRDAWPEDPDRSAPSGLACLDGVLRQVWSTGYGHHITRLMILSNLATLLDIDPQALSDWFWVAYEDAYDWVVEPNVLGMGTFSVGEAMTTKPYISGAAYIDRMSDFCRECAFDPAVDCPITPLYWAFLDRHGEALRPVGRMRLPLASGRKRGAERRRHDQEVYRFTRRALTRGETLNPQSLPRDGR